VFARSTFARNSTSNIAIVFDMFSSTMTILVITMGAVLFMAQCYLLTALFCLQ